MPSKRAQVRTVARKFAATRKQEFLVQARGFFPKGFARNRYLRLLQETNANTAIARLESELTTRIIHGLPVSTPARRNLQNAARANLLVEEARAGTIKKTDSIFLFETLLETVEKFNRTSSNQNSQSTGDNLNAVRTLGETLNKIKLSKQGLKLSEKNAKISRILLGWRMTQIAGTENIRLLNQALENAMQEIIQLEKAG